MLQDSILQVKHLTAGYPGKGPIVKDISFSLKKGECLAIFGSLGAGKTTIAMTVLGFIKPIYGIVLIDDTNIFYTKRKELRRIRRKIQPVFQDPFLSLHPMKKIGTILRDSAGENGREKAENCLNTVGLPSSYMSYLPSQLSGGELQRVCIAKALCTAPEILVLDEPFTAQDYLNRLKLASLLQQLRTSRNLSYLLITHDIFMISLLSERVLLLEKGRITEELTPEKFRKRYINEL